MLSRFKNLHVILFVYEDCQNFYILSFLLYNTNSNNLHRKFNAVAFKQFKFEIIFVI